MRLRPVSYHFFRLIRDSYLEIALVYFYLKKPKKKVSATVLKVTAVFIGIRRCLSLVVSSNSERIRHFPV